VWRINADGSGAAPLTDKVMDAKESTHRFPFFLPDGDHFVFFGGNFSSIDEQYNALYLGSLSNPRQRVLLTAARSSGVFAAGRLYYVDANGALVAAPMDVAHGKLTAAPQAIEPKVARSPSTYYVTFSISTDSTLVYSAAGVTGNSQLTWFDIGGKEVRRLGPVGVMANPAVSPDGRRVAFDSNDFKANNVDVWIFDLIVGGASRFTFDPIEEVGPVWSRDGSMIAYRTIRHAAPNLELKKTDGLTAPKDMPDLADASGDVVPNSWASGGREILCTYQPAHGGFELVLQPVDGGNMRTLLRGPGSVTNGQISPDGKWVAYASNETGDWEIYATTFPGSAGKWQVSRGGGTEPRWRNDGKAIYFVGPQQMLTEAIVSTDGGFSAAGPREMFAIRRRAPISSTDLFTYDVLPSGKGFLVNQYVKPEQIPPLSIVLHADRAAGR
jgi:roadblock/LC7 domain-containing protein